MFRRLKNLWLLSRYRPNEFTDKSVNSILQIDIVKKKPATIVQDNPLDQFPTQNTESV